jgi:hypothetical protein
MFNKIRGSRSSLKRLSECFVILSRFRHFPPRYYRPTLTGNLFQHDILRDLSHKVKDPNSFESKFLRDDEKIAVAVATKNVVNILGKVEISKFIYCRIE